MSEQAQIAKIENLISMADQYAAQGCGPAHVLYRELMELRGMFGAIPAEVHPKIWACLVERKVINAIREHRDIYRSSLKDAKDAVEAMIAKYFPAWER